MASFPNRCQHIKVNGTLCGCPALRRNKLCYFHKRHHDERIQLNADRARRRPATLDLPVLEDANSIQVSLMQIMRALVAGQIDGKIAGLLLYALQTASVNLRNTSFEPYMQTIVLDPRTVGEIPLNSDIWKDSDFATDEDDRAAALAAARRKAEKKAELDRWAEAEANRITQDGIRKREAAHKAAVAFRAAQDVRDAAAAARQDAVLAEVNEAARQDAAAAARARTLRANPHPSSASRGTESADAPAATQDQLRSPAVTPAGHAVLPSSPATPPAPSPGKRPPAHVNDVNMDEVRKKVREQIRKELPSLAAAIRQQNKNGGSSA
jgi:hypothetical protein